MIVIKIKIKTKTNKKNWLCLAALIACATAGFAQTLTPLKNQPPDGAQLTFQLTDGTVLAQGNGNSDWWKLTPDIKGSYLNGTWTQMASLASNYSPSAFASSVLADGRLVIIGGEYNFNNFELTNLAAIYDPAANTWTPLTLPKPVSYVGDSPSVVLPNGTFLFGDKLVKGDVALDPKTMKWTYGFPPGKSDFNAEEGWTLLPDGTVITADVKHAPNSEIFNPATRTWTSAGSTIVDLHSPSPFGCLPFGPNEQYCYYPPGEIGPAILRPDGTVFFTGSTPQDGTSGNTAIYTPGANGAIGTWAVGPSFPPGDDAGDNFAVLLTNGHVLVNGNSNYSYEFDGINLTRGLVTGRNSLMDLPTGEVLVGGSELYTSTGTYQQAWAPTITTVPSSVTRGTTYPISGTQFNGLSQAGAFGDEYQTATNYPLVRITNTATGHVFYAKTHDHSTMGVATGSKIVSTNFDVPTTMETGASKLEVVANGIPSTAVNVTVN